MENKVMKVAQYHLHTALKVINENNGRIVACTYSEADKEYTIFYVRETGRLD